MSRYSKDDLEASWLIQQSGQAVTSDYSTACLAQVAVAVETLKWFAHKLAVTMDFEHISESCQAGHKKK